MEENGWEKLAAATGIAFVVLAIASNVIVPPPPKLDDPVQKIVAYVTDNRTMGLLSGYLGGLAFVFALWFLGSLRSYLRRTEGGDGRLSAVAFGGGLILGGVFLVGTAAFNAMLLHADQLDAAVVRVIYDMAGVLFCLIWFPAAVWLGATGVSSLRSGAFPRWHALAGIVLGLLFIVMGAGSSMTSGPLAIGGVLWVVAFILMSLWVLVTSILLIQRVGAPVQVGGQVVGTTAREGERSSSAP